MEHEAGIPRLAAGTGAAVHHQKIIDISRRMWIMERDKWRLTWRLRLFGSMRRF